MFRVRTVEWDVTSSIALYGWTDFLRMNHCFWAEEFCSGWGVVRIVLRGVGWNGFILILHQCTIGRCDKDSEGVFLVWTCIYFFLFSFGHCDLAYVVEGQLKGSSWEVPKIRMSLAGCYCAFLGERIYSDFPSVYDRTMRWDTIKILSGVFIVWTCTFLSLFLQWLWSGVCRGRALFFFSHCFSWNICRDVIADLMMSSILCGRAGRFSILCGRAGALNRYLEDVVSTYYEHLSALKIRRIIRCLILSTESSLRQERESCSGNFRLCGAHLFGSIVENKSILYWVWSLLHHFRPVIFRSTFLPLCMNRQRSAKIFSFHCVWGGHTCKASPANSLHFNILWFNVIKFSECLFGRTNAP